MVCRGIVLALGISRPVNLRSLLLVLLLKRRLLARRLLQSLVLRKKFAQAACRRRFCAP